jgi:hypothetical protein
MLANIKRPLLRLIPPQTIGGTVVHDVFVVQQFVPVLQKHIQKFSLTIKSGFEDDKPLATYRPITAVLFFRPRQ